MTPAAIALVDLDDSIMQTRRKCPAEVPAERLTAMAFDRAGQAISFSTPAQIALVDWLTATTHVVAVTARDVAALLRTRLAFRMAVVSHGGAILPGPRDATGQPPPVAPDWHALMQERLAPAASALAGIALAVADNAAALGIPVRARVIAEAGLPLYVVVKHGAAEPIDAELHRACRAVIAGLPAGWTVHVNGNNIALLPPGLGKQHAVAWLLPTLKARYPDLPVIGIGDSFTDAPFMALCDFAMTPTGSQLAGRLLGPVVAGAGA